MPSFVLKMKIHIILFYRDLWLLDSEQNKDSIGITMMCFRVNTKFYNFQFKFSKQYLNENILSELFFVYIDSSVYTEYNLYYYIY